MRGLRSTAMNEPIEPSKEDCCNSGCNPCIFDVYEQQLKIYKKFLETGQTSISSLSENAISQSKYMKFILIEVIQLCEAHLQLLFRTSDFKRVWWKPGDHFLLKFNNEHLSCTRAYTPLKCRKQSAESDFSIIVKVYENGLVSNYLNDLKVGDETLWRGPYGSYDITPNKFRRIIMIAQGTGIAPYISIIENILDNEDDFTIMVLYYCTKNEDSILMREELYNFKDYWNFSYKIFLSSTTNKKIKYQEPIVIHKLRSADISMLQPFTYSDQILISGSEDFMKDIERLIKSETDLFENIHLF